MKRSEKPAPKARQRSSRQRDRILELLRSTGSHPTAAWVFEQLAKEFPSLSLGTVYRNIGILIDQGLIRRADVGGGLDRFDAKTSQHYHFVCERCGRIVDLETPVDTALNERVTTSTGLEIHGHQINFYGVCPSCKTSK